MGTLMEFVEANIRYELLLVIWFLHLWELYLSYRQRCLMKKLSDLPDSLNGIMTKEEYAKARLYALDKNSFSIVKDFYSTITSTIYLWIFAFHYFWKWGVQLAVAIGIDESNEILVSPAFMFIMSCVSTIFDLPITIYHIFVLEEKHGFNKQTVPFFIKDQLKKFVVSQIIVLPIVAGIVWIIKSGGDYFFYYLWLFTVIVTLFMMILYPEVIAPLFDTYYPLPEGTLKTKIEALASSVNFPLYKLYIVKGSNRSTHSNAYMYGFHKHKRIVLFDTLVKEYYKPEKEDDNKNQGCETDEVLAVLAHELGHWKYNHTLLGFLLSQVSFVINFLSFAKLMDYTPMYVAFGFEDSKPIFIGLVIVIVNIMSPLNTLKGFLMMFITRWFEFQADGFAKKLGHAEALKNALIKLEKDNLGYPLYDKLYTSWHHSHPPLLVRLEALEKAN